MVDLESQYQKVKNEIDTAVLLVMQNTNFIQGNEVQLFSKMLSDFLNTKFVIPCGNGTDALQISLMALNLPQGSEVIVPSFCYVAAAEAIALLGFKPVFAEVEESTFNIDVKKIELLITENTKVIIPVHLFGQSCDMLGILKIAQKYNLYVIEDNAQAIGADYYFPDNTSKKLGTIGHMGITSFFPTKNLACMGDGGALFTNDEYLAARIKMIANHGQKEKYLHETIGINSRLDTIQAAVLNVKLKYLNNYNEARQKAASQYDNLLGNISELSIPARTEKSNHVFHQYIIKVKNGKRDDLKKHLQEKGIPTMVYYPQPLHKQKAYASFYQNQDLSISEKLSSEVLALPMHTELSEEQIVFISENIAAFFQQK